jgi:AcrR family transcriptional regulator
VNNHQDSYRSTRWIADKPVGNGRRLTGPAGEIVLAARKLYESDGVASTTVKDIAAEAGVTRELVYYYFENKQAISDAVIDDYVEDLVESVILWNEQRQFGDAKGSLRACVRAFRHTLYGLNGPRPMLSVVDQMGRREEFDIRVVCETVDCLNTYVMGEYTTYRKVGIELVYEMFCVVIFGLVGLLKVKPDISDEALMKVVEQTLHLDMTQLQPPTPEPAPAIPAAAPCGSKPA